MSEDSSNGAESSARTTSGAAPRRPQDEATLPATPRGVSASPKTDRSLDKSRSHIEALHQGQVIDGRYEIRSKLGRGGFGAVYSAYDQSLNRLVAIKQSTGLRTFVHGQVRNEARAVASLNHPNIVQIHDLVQVNPQELLIVMECLEGVSLSGRMRQSRISIVDSVKIGVELASALMHAHEKQLVHSDLKPANLFLCNTGLVKLLDFGLAVAYFPDTSIENIGGTPGYMSPEQVRGESHLIDGRTDIWAFGVVMYEMLTGTRPFSGDRRRTTSDRTLVQSVPPPRQLNPEIENELQRIVLKCLQPLIKLRYASAAELREDLLHWLESQGERATTGLTARLGKKSESQNELVPSSSIRLGKRGLQPFTELDASTYLSLIPGPRDRNGVPDSIRFWKRWVESDDPETEYPVGVLYGPSGSGKTSYVRAGLFKQLSPDVCRVYIECRSGDLGGRLTRIVESRLQSGSGKSSLRDLLLRWRSDDSHSHGFHKMLIVLDQFESWAHTATLDERLDFAEALRQCDGIQIRALVVTRDDYWSGAKELLHWLEMPMQEGRNVASIDLLDRSHAEQILEAMGRESETLPPEGEPLTSQQQQFIEQAVNELAIDESVICVHLVMSAQMVRLQKWTPRALHSSGGVAGACSLFFQELFEKSSRHSPEYQRVAPAASVVLAKLVPPAGSTVAEVSVTQQELNAALKESGQSHLIDDCMRVLSEDLRIVTIVGADSPEPDVDTAGKEDRFRLAHDFLVDPVNVFLSRMQNRTWRGRTKSRLSELSDTWSRRQINAHLPGFTEYLTLLAGSLFHRHSETESRFLHAAARLHAGRVSVAVVALIAFLMMSAVAWHQWTAAGEATRRELTAKVDLLLNGPAEEVSSSIEELRSFGPDARVELQAWSDSVDPSLRLRSQMFLQSVQPESLSAIASMLGDAPTEFFQPILRIADSTVDSVSVLKAAATDAGDSVRANRAAILLAYLGDNSAILTRLAGSNNADVDQAFVLEATRWRGEPNLWADLVNITTHDPQVRYHASAILGSYPRSHLQKAGLTFDYDSLINHPDATIHSIGRYLAHHMGESVFDIRLNPPADANWRVGPDNIPMVRLEPASFEFQPVTLESASKQRSKIAVEVERPFWMATIPVSRRLYAEFVASDAKLPDGSPLQVTYDRFIIPDYLTNDDNQPILGTSLAQAYVFCNWLSRREGFDECYRSIQVEPVILEREKRTKLRAIPWAFDHTANGYRVPTVSEFRLVAYCKYEQGAAWQNAIEIARSSGSTANPRFAHPIMELIPSRLGPFVFDQHCGSWVSSSNGITGQSVWSTETRDNRLTRPLALPGNTIFLTQNTADE